MATTEWLLTVDGTTEVVVREESVVEQAPNKPMSRVRAGQELLNANPYPYPHTPATSTHTALEIHDIPYNEWWWWWWMVHSQAQSPFLLPS